MIEYIVIFILLTLNVVLGYFAFRSCKKSDCPVCDDVTIMKLDYDYKQGEPPNTPMSDKKGSEDGIKNAAGNWDFLWSVKNDLR